MMRALLLALLPVLALAQPAPSGGGSGNCGKPSATCQSKHFIITTGGDLLPPSDLGASLGSASKRFVSIFAATFKDGASLNRLIFSTAQGNTYVGGIPDGASAVGHLLNTSDSLTTSGAKLVSFQNASVEKASIDKDGDYITSGFISASSGFGQAGTGGASQGMQFSGSSTFIVGGGAGALVQLNDNSGSIYAKFGTTGITTASVNNPVPVVHAAQTTSAVAMEFGRSAASVGGALAVSFATAFASAPSCTCLDENAVPVACGITSAPTTAGVTFAVLAARADTVDWQCIGAK